MGRGGSAFWWGQMELVGSSECFYRNHKGISNSYTLCFYLDFADTFIQGHLQLRQDLIELFEDYRSCSSIQQWQLGGVGIWSHNLLISSPVALTYCHDFPVHCMVLINHSAFFLSSAYTTFHWSSTWAALCRTPWWTWLWRTLVMRLCTRCLIHTIPQNVTLIKHYSLGLLILFKPVTKLLLF